MRDLFPVLRVLGLLLVFFALSMAVPLGASWIWDDGVWQAWPGAMGVTVVLGLVLWAVMREHKRELQPRHGVILVTLVWLCLPLSAALPMMLVYHQLGLQLSFTHAYFEAVSGLTTAGSSVLQNLDALPVSLNI